MIKRDYELIAAILHSLKPPSRAHLAQSLGWRAACNTFAAELAKDNPKFDRVYFLIACDYAQTS